MDNNKQREIAEIVESSLKVFRESMEVREQLSIRIGNRTTRIIRTGITANMQIMNNQFINMNRTRQTSKPMKMFSF
jgi:hypothetical protein